MSDGYYIILIQGNPIEGFVIYGPFDTEDEAANYGAAGDKSWWVTRLEEPT